ncbi:DUF5615 family PIN-like protein [Natrinema soli]|uniref:DUF5615 family PIN-like protein n=1 Tax=Natrinema soli TaxID=1930624 RepID=A0ABD5SH65_9EURY|nr:DUF5615 family PIN-like protein [Natrinema soli]
MRLLADENVRPAHVLALKSAGHDIVQVEEVLEKGAPDTAVLEAAQEAERSVLTYDRKDFSAMSDHAGVFICDEQMAPREVRRTVEQVNQVYPTLDDVVEFLSDWV